VTAYSGRHAELYDLFYHDKPYQKEADFVHGCLQRFCPAPPRRILELACGTGTHALLLEKRGYEVEAVDASPAMISRAIAKAETTGARVAFRVEDMRELAVPPSAFDAVICLFDSIGYVQTNEALHRVLEGVVRSLRQDGLFLFEFWHAAAMLGHYEPLRVRSWVTSEGEVLRIARTRLEPREQTARVEYKVYELGRDGSFTSFEETQTNRYFLVQEMRAWLEMAGLVPLRWYSGFSEDEVIRADTWHVVAVARKGGGPPPVIGDIEAGHSSER
jgi:SAM-dependent methyltransferase